MPLSFILFAPMSFCHLPKAVMASYNLQTATTTTTKPNRNKKYNPPNTITLRKHVQSKFLLLPQGASISDCAQGQSKIRDRGCKGGGRLGGRGSSSWGSGGCGIEEAPWSTRSLLKRMENLCFPGLGRVMQSNYSNQAAPGRSHHLPPPALLPCYSSPPFLSHQGRHEQGDRTPWP